MTTPTEAPDAPEGITLLGSEMFTWSDLDSDRGPAGGALFEEFLGIRVTDRRVPRALVVGPHSRDLIVRVAALADVVDVHVRSLPDAQTLRAELPDNVTLLCGALGRLAAGGAYDLVVALDGMDRVASVEETPVGWHDLFARVAGQVADGGTLLVAVGNRLGLDRLLAVDPHNLDRDDAWPMGTVGADLTAPGLDDARRALAAAAPSAEVSTWAAFGRRTAPALVASESMLTGSADDPRTAVLVERAARDLDAAQTTTRDLGEVAREMVAHRRGLDAAPLWLLAAGRDPAATGAETGEETAALTLAAGVPTAITSGWHRRALAESAHRLTAGVVADPALLDGGLPTGPLVADLLTDCVRTQDMTRAGELVRRYRTWLATDGGEAAPEKIAITLDNLVDTGAGLVPFDPHLHTEVSAPIDEVVARTLLVLARSLLASGIPHAWPSTYGPEQAVRSLIAASGVELDDAGIAAATALDERLGGAPAAAVRPTYAEALEELDRLRRGQVEAEVQLEWLVRNIHDRQRLSRKLRARIWRLERSPEYRIGAKALAVRRRAGAAARKAKVKLGLSEPPAIAPPDGEWREAPQVEREQVPVEPDLLPPGYKPSGPTV